jgi:pyruvate,water dikinase
MDSQAEWVIPLAGAQNRARERIGGKAAMLARLAHHGFRVPDGFCITASAYEYFVRQSGLVDVIRMELGRKSFESMRWEEIWDAALRIRSAFLARPIPLSLVKEIGGALDLLGPDLSVAVRSSALGEDAAEGSFAGLHESVVGVSGLDAVLDAVRTVWSSLWSDAALLYRQELSLDPAQSRMAVLVQEVISRDRSGVAFGRDPRTAGQDRVIIEAVPGPCSDLVDGVVDPDHWELALATGKVLAWRPGERPDEHHPRPILGEPDLNQTYSVLRRIESLFGWPPDVEWTGRAEDYVLLQARPISTLQPVAEDDRAWYLTLRPSMRRLQELRDRVANEYIPQLKELGQRLAAEALEPYDDRRLAEALLQRFEAVQEWKRIYWDEFIPFAHGVRQLGIYYNDAVRPEDPYEFVDLLRGQEMLAAQRNQALEKLARYVKSHERLQHAVRSLVASAPSHEDGGAQAALARLKVVPGGPDFVAMLHATLERHMDVAYEGQRLASDPLSILRIVLQTTESLGPANTQEERESLAEQKAGMLEQRLLEAVGPARHAEAREVLATARLSWRLRDDDNVLVGRLESQLLRALHLGADRLRASGRLHAGAALSEEAAPLVAKALQDASGGPLHLPASSQAQRQEVEHDGDEQPRQLVGQPAAPGLATGKARRVRGSADLGHFVPGEVLVCDAIQPTMTHLVPLACAVVERRGGMLIHGAIIARELGIPCVNGISGVIESLRDGEVITVDGYLGIVTVGPPEFELEGVPYQEGAT